MDRLTEKAVDACCLSLQVRETGARVGLLLRALTDQDRESQSVYRIGDSADPSGTLDVYAFLFMAGAEATSCLGVTFPL